MVLGGVMVMVRNNVVQTKGEGKVVLYDCELAAEVHRADGKKTCQ